MGVYINMEMPKICAVCPFENYGDCYGGKVKVIMDIDDYVFSGKRHPKCPLIPVPEHGRLIDADAMIRNIERAIAPSWYIKERNADMVKFLSLEDTIIPAESLKEEI